MKDTKLIEEEIKKVDGEIDSTKRELCQLLEITSEAEIETAIKRLERDYETSQAFDEIRQIDAELAAIESPPSRASVVISLAKSQAFLSSTIQIKKSPTSKMTTITVPSVFSDISKIIEEAPLEESSTCLDAFRATVTVSHLVECSKSPHKTAVLSNCLSLLAHRAASRSICHPQEVGSSSLSLSAAACAVDSDRILREEVAVRLSESISPLELGGRGLGGTWEPAASAAADSALGDVARRCRIAVAAWRESGVGRWVWMAESLLTGIGAEVVRRIFEIGDISEPEAHSLHKSLGHVTTSLVRDVLQQHEEGSKVAGWTKLEKVRELLEMPLVKIGDEWRAGNLTEFKENELIKLVESLFSDSKLRQSVIKSIGNPPR